MRGTPHWDVDNKCDMDVVLFAAVQNAGSLHLSGW